MKKIILIGILIFLILNVNAECKVEYGGAFYPCTTCFPLMQNLTINFEKCYVDKECIISVQSDKNFIREANVSIKKDNKEIFKGKTDNKGNFKFIPEESGVFTIEVKKENFYPAKKEISIDKGNLYIESPNKVKLNEEIKIYV
ncbi:MAG: hypothetical protein ACK4YO_04175, partial [Candidatus Altarchaeaceae archaeon]